MRDGLVLLGVLLACLGCASGPEQTTENYFPLAVGNRWIYTRDGTTPAETVSVTESFLNAHNVRVYKWVGGGPTMYASNSDGRAVLCSNPDGTSDSPILMEPFAVGTTWCDGNDSARIEDTKASVSLHAGEFTDCVRISYRTGGQETRAFYSAPGVGYVKLVIAGQAETVELFGYEVK